MAKTKAALYREYLKEPGLLVSPGVYDGYSAKLAEQAGFKVMSTTGAGISNAFFGQPDIGLMSLMENVDICRMLVRSVNVPMTADAESGYGNVVSVYHAIEYFEEAGIVGVNLEDQGEGKRCGHMEGKQVVETAYMCKKLEAACKARKDKDFLIIARTDAIAVEGIDSAVERLKEYVKVGADMVFADAVETEDQIKQIVDNVDAPLSVNMGFAIRSRPTTPLIPFKRLEEIGVKRVSLARMMPAAAIMGMKKSLEIMKEVLETGEMVDRPDLLVGIEDIMELMSYPHIRAIEKEFMLDEEYERRFKKTKAAAE
jgi:2-methylisocitrate lyase-like PEP mutase family enzyme